MEESFPHLRLQREEPVTEKRTGGRRIPVAPSDPVAHGRTLQQRLETAKSQAATAIGGFDDRPLFRFTVEKGFDPDALRKISADIEVVSQEGVDMVVAFVSTAALESFEAGPIQGCALRTSMAGPRMTVLPGRYAREVYRQTHPSFGRWKTDLQSAHNYGGRLKRGHLQKESPSSIALNKMVCRYLGYAATIVTPKVSSTTEIFEP